MSRPIEKVNNWAELSSAFNDDVKTTADRRKTTKRQANDIDFLEKASGGILGSKRSNNIESLSKLIEACEPKKVSDLAVSKQKQREIDDWLATAHTGKPRILVLSGPSGCGKTAALKILANDNGYQVVEWTTPPDSLAYENQPATRQDDKFSDFLIRTTRYNSVFCTNSPRLLLVKDIPNIYLVKPDSFLTLLETYQQYGKQPLVFICTDGGSSKMIKTLFPPEVKQRLNIDSIGVHSTTQAAMKNMLKRVSAILNSRASRFINVQQRNIDEVLSNSTGDVRNAILNLIFNSLRVTDKTLKHDCEIREESLGLLHAIGRVINPKRIQSGNSWKFVHDPDEIASYFQSQSATFLYFLHENYVNTMSEVEEIDVCANIMSLSDLMTNEWRDPNLSKLNLSFCVRGIMANNKKPVSGWNPVRKPRSEEAKVSRNLGTAEEGWYKSIIRPRDDRRVSNLDNTLIEQDSD